MMNNVSFSIIIPVYNAEKFLDECINSVLNQDYDNYEIILIDDGSTDESPKKCDYYREKYSKFKIVHKSNAGQLSARLEGIKNSEKEYLIFLDADDWLSNNALSTLNRYIIKLDLECLVFGLQQEKEDKIYDIWSETQEIIITDKSQLYKKILFDTKYNSMCRKCVKREIAQYTSLEYEQFYWIRHGEDLLQSMNILKKANKVFFVPNVLYHYRYNADSVSHKWSYDTYIVDYTLFDYIIDFLKKENVWNQEDFDELYSFFFNLILADIKMILLFDVKAKMIRRKLEEVRNAGFVSTYINKINPKLLGGIKDYLMFLALKKKMYELLMLSKYIYKLKKIFAEQVDG